MEVKNELLFNLTFYDFINHLIPGLLLLLFLYLIESPEIAAPIEVQIIMILTLGYVIGHFLLIIGNILYNTYFHPRQYEKRTVKYRFVLVVHGLIKIIVRQKYVESEEDVIYKEVAKLVSKKLKIKGLDNLGLFGVCDSLVAKSGFSERGILLARQGFYRSISAMLILLIPYAMYRRVFELPAWFWLGLLAFCLRLLLYAHTYFGQIRRKQIYLLAYKELREEV